MKRDGAIGEELRFWAGVASECGQVTFGLALASMFVLGIDLFRLFVIGSNVLLSVGFWLLGRWLIRRSYL